MKIEDLIAALRRLKVQTGSLACLGCEQEHNCGVHGCRILQEAIKELETLSGPECGRIDVERLTELCYKKSDGYYARCSEHCNDICDCNCEKWGEIVDRLGAYEDTSLEPEEIGLLAKQRDLYVDACGEPPLKRIRNLAQADREGRCVVLPCKVGDTVYRVVTPTPGPPLLSEMKITTMKQAASLVNLVGKHKLVSYYLTREEAEAALREEEK
jgi:hypothetical protein|uniref:Uncharacterized protein n=1 Tax=Siphoviridae sp. ctxS04 TaxID=2823610 RepID=A0A8S5LHE0_9CAUD|nr:MAG TPA: hypothetical protein [Siphoviridae sp. ctxS04]